MDVAVDRWDGDDLSDWVLTAAGLSTFRDTSTSSDRTGCRMQRTGCRGATLVPGLIRLTVVFFPGFYSRSWYSFLLG